MLMVFFFFFFLSFAGAYRHGSINWSGLNSYCFCCCGSPSHFLCSKLNMLLLVLGNHDYRGNVKAQLSPILRKIDSRWLCMRSFILKTGRNISNCIHYSWFMYSFHVDWNFLITNGCNMNFSHAFRNCRAILLWHNSICG